MNVKKYRAETTREALEQIKMDLGEDAFVLETKQVKTRGFMGLGAKTQIEISAAPSMETSSAGARKSQKTAFANNSIFNLTDNAPAMPQVANQAKKIEKMEIMNALQSRAASVSNFDKSFPYNPKTMAQPVPQREFEAVEISTEAPKVVHPKKEIIEPKFEVPSPTPKIEVSSPTPNMDVPAPTPKNVLENPSTTVSSRELDLLRAELREVKFSINAFAGRQNSQTSQSSMDVDAFSEVFDPPFSSAYEELTAMGISREIAHNLVAEIIPQYKNGSIALNQITQASLRTAVLSLIKFGEDPLSGSEPAVLAVIGSTGVGKTTTVAKLAARIALEERRRVELVTLDTYRIAAVEQLKTYAEIIGAGCHVVRSVLELDVLIRRFPADVTVLIDTTGRNPHDLADQHELSDYLKRHSEIRKCLAVQATTHPLDAIAAIKKFEMYGADCLAITKLDETTRPGAMLEVLAESNLPLTYLCMGQRVPEDLKVATPENFSVRVFGETL